LTLHERLAFVLDCGKSLGFPGRVQHGLFRCLSGSQSDRIDVNEKQTTGREFKWNVMFKHVTADGLGLTVDDGSKGSHESHGNQKGCSTWYHCDLQL
jgi:hypothetical protein